MGFDKWFGLVHSSMHLCLIKESKRKKGGGGEIKKMGRVGDKRGREKGYCLWNGNTSLVFLIAFQKIKLLNYKNLLYKIS